ncbi:hypothetical protein FIBSPDRAFT_953730 [Athelia psychrophila]|uniref:Uncharacterized protein n=1 Tax=Athelia psychrophila TaxID=1759441 RepID=A0A166K2Y8_9AGAM|nr:hypothetical protein FIBSPDRAFT_953730 [Fibularhizoctonia sp. CBS 109695]
MIHETVPALGDWFNDHVGPTLRVSICFACWLNINLFSSYLPADINGANIDAHQAPSNTIHAQRPLSSVSGSISSTSLITSSSSAAPANSTTGNVGGTSGNPIKKFQVALSSR